jgi:hypothetical protein
LKFIDPSGHEGTLPGSDPEWYGEQYSFEYYCAAFEFLCLKFNLDLKSKNTWDFASALPLFEKRIMKTLLETISPEKGYIVLWGYKDEISLLPGYSHSYMIAVDKNGNFFRIESWGGSLGVGEELYAQIIKPGQIICCEDGQWNLGLGIQLGIGVEGLNMQGSISNKGWFHGSAEKQNNKGENWFVGLNISISVNLTRFAIIPISATEAANLAKKENYPWYYRNQND